MYKFLKGFRQVVMILGTPVVFLAGVFIGVTKELDKQAELYKK